jgi:putative spermidine/putrescine transport system permease protein
VLSFVRLLLSPVAAASLALAVSPLTAVILLGLPSVAALQDDPIWLEAALRSLLLAEVAVLVGWPAGCAAAFAIWGAQTGARRGVLGIGLVPLLLPSAWVVHGLGLIAEGSGLHGAHLIALALGHAAPSASIALLVMTGFLNRLDPMLLRTAAGCGASPFMAWRLILLPALALPLALSAAAAFALSLGRIELDRAVAPPHHPSLAGLLGTAAQAGDTATAPAALVLCLMAALALAIAGLLPLLRRRPV